MNCPSCGRENPDANRFCGSCGAAIERGCPACGHTNPPDHRFCGKCGSVLESGATTPAEAVDRAGTGEGERRQLSVMFCDLVDSTALAARMDDEDYREVVGAYQRVASQVIDRYEGQIGQYLGDGLLVYFGYPRAHEDDANRAVRAGLEIVAAIGRLNDELERAHGVRLAVRVGIHTGPVVIGEMGSGPHRATQALGATMNLAARLEGVAEPDQVVISEATLRLVSGLFLTQDLGTPPLKGVADPVPAYRVVRPTGVRRRLDVDPGRLTPLVGRDHEVGLLLDRWAQALEGEGQAVLISGEAGVGKSRLLHAFHERLAGEPHSWLECRSTPYTQGSAFYPLVEVLEHGLGFQEGDDAETKLERLERELERGELDAPEVVPFIAPLLLLPLPGRYPPREETPELQRKKTIAALVAWLLALADRQPLVMLVEDLHWCDASTVEFLGLLLEQSARAPVLTLLTFRPDFEPPWSKHSHVAHLDLSRLRRGEAEKLIGGVVGRSSLPDPIVARIVDRADGVPLFLEELTKMILDSDLVEEREGHYELKGELTDLAIPATLQDSLMARLDKLEEGKPVAQRGAALGREFTYELLEAVSPMEPRELGRGLTQLIDAELLYQRGTPPDLTFTFKHAMVQDTAYQSLLKSARRELHARIAEVLEERFPERVEVEPEVIARHYDEAGLADPAIAHYQRAGERETERSANEEALGHLRRALELLATLPATTARTQRELRLQLTIARPLSIVVGWPASTYERARELAAQVGDDHERCVALIGLDLAYCMMADVATAIPLAKEAVEIAERLDEGTYLVSAHAAAGYSFYFCGEFRQALRHLEPAMQLYAPGQGTLFTMNSGVFGHGSAAQCLWALGQSDRALAIGQKAVEIATHEKQPAGTAFALYTQGHVHLERGERDLAHQCAEDAIALSERVGYPLGYGLGKVLLGRAGSASRKGERLDEIEQGLAELAQGGNLIPEPTALLWLGEGFWKAERHGDALRAIERGIARAEETTLHGADAELHRLKAEMLLGSEGASAEQAETLLHRALEIARSQETKSFELRAATRLARLLQWRGEMDQARALLAPVYDWFTEGFDTQDLKDAKALLEELGSCGASRD